MNMPPPTVIRYCTIYLFQTLDDSPHWIDLPRRNGDETFELAIPAIYTVDRSKDTKALVDADYTKRLDPQEIMMN